MNRFFGIVLCCLSTLAMGSFVASQAQDNASQNTKNEIPPATVREIRMLERILEDRPHDPAVLFNLALDEVIIGEREKAIQLLEEMAQAHTGMDPKDPAGRLFQSFSSDPRFIALIKQIEKENPSIVRSTHAFVIHERDLAPEGIAYDRVGRKFYVSSLVKQKIVCVGLDGSVTDFKNSGEDGLGSTLGMKVDAKRRILWVVSVLWHPDAKQSPAGVFQYDLKTGKLQFKHQLPAGASGFLNDVALTSSGDAFATNTGTGEVFRMSPDHDGIELFLPANSVPQANGISVSNDDKMLFVAGWIGIVRVDIATKQFRLLAKPHNISDAGLDGMYFYNGSLVGIQNPDLHPGRVMRYFLNPSMDTIQRAEVLESYNPLFDIPTTATIVDESLYFMANTQIEKQTDGRSTVPLKEWRDIEVVKLKL
ncbi:MAG TPA: hypothetical protein VFA74_06605 [Terriglobales bacterium]|nr:hypothetical protein [Terriglobales bacterium]